MGYQVDSVEQGALTTDVIVISVETIAAAKTDGVKVGLLLEKMPTAGSAVGKIDI